ncbi:hypothetical protein G6F19_010355 [Rhizopus arrhizus]|nr:hypothetical protein G6F19_010355 [Rhizopus arrhizus]
MAVVLLRRLCPFCDEHTASSVSDYFYSHYNLRRHIKRRHGHDLPSRKRSDQIKKARVYRWNSVPKLEEGHGTFEWVIEGVNILAMFYAYSEANRLQQAEMRLLVKNDAKKILLPGMFSSAVADISEAELLASYVHPFMQALFSGWEPQRVPHASDKVFSDDNITNNARSDYIVDVYKQADVRYANVIGELKAQGSINTS